MVCEWNVNESKKGSNNFTSNLIYVSFPGLAGFSSGSVLMFHSMRLTEFFFKKVELDEGQETTPLDDKG